MCIEIKSWQTNQSLSYSNNLADFNNVNKEFLQKNFSQKNPPKKFLQKNSSKKILQKIPPKNSSKKIPKKIQKRFLKYPMPYIALRGRKPFQACSSFELLNKLIKRPKSSRIQNCYSRFVFQQKGPERIWKVFCIKVVKSSKMQKNAYNCGGSLILSELLNERFTDCDTSNSHWGAFTNYVCT